MRIPPLLKPAIHAARHDRRGVAAAEFALIAPILVTMLFGVFNLGSAIHELLLVRQALRAGGLYALSFPTQLGLDSSPTTANNGILLAVQQALPTNWTVNVNPAPSGTTNVNLTVSPAQLSGSPPLYITLTASLDDAFLKALDLNSASYVVRIQ